MEFNGGREENDIVNWVLKKSGPSTTELTCDQLSSKLADTKLAVAYFGDFKGHHFEQVYLEVSNHGSVAEKF
jgi:hypothetical protein